MRTAVMLNLRTTAALRNPECGGSAIGCVFLRGHPATVRRATGGHGTRVREAERRPSDTVQERHDKDNCDIGKGVKRKRKVM